MVTSTESRQTQRDRVTVYSVVLMHIYFQLTFACPNAFHPCVLKLGVAETSTPPEPGTTVTAATGFARVAGATLGTCGARLSSGSGDSGRSSGSGKAGGTGSSGGTGDSDNQSHGFCEQGNMSV